MSITRFLEKHPISEVCSITLAQVSDDYWDIFMRHTFGKFSCEGFYIHKIVPLPDWTYWFLEAGSIPFCSTYLKHILYFSLG